MEKPTGETNKGNVASVYYRRLLRAHLGVVSKQISKSPLFVGEFYLWFLATLRDEMEGCDVKVALLDPRPLCPGSLLMFGTSRLKSLTRDLVASLSLVQSRPWDAHSSSGRAVEPKLKERYSWLLQAWDFENQCRRELVGSERWHSALNDLPF